MANAGHRSVYPNLRLGIAAAGYRPIMLFQVPPTTEDQ